MIDQSRHFLTVRGNQIVKQDGQRVALRGFGLGGWMTMENFISGLAGYDQLMVLRGLMGGVFIRHPPQCPVTVEPRAGHALAAGGATFTVADEHYFIDLDDDQADVFLTTASEHGTQPGGWTRTEGAGRVCVLTPGHNVEVWLDPSYQVIIQNALRWVTAQPHSKGF
jgi:type 1 glutamine amidotransferase